MAARRKRGTRIGGTQLKNKCAYRWLPSFPASMLPISSALVKWQCQFNLLLVVHTNTLSRKNEAAKTSPYFQYCSLRYTLTLLFFQPIFLLFFPLFGALPSWPNHIGARLICLIEREGNILMSFYYRSVVNDDAEDEQKRALCSQSVSSSSSSFFSSILHPTHTTTQSCQKRSCTVEKE